MTTETPRWRRMLLPVIVVAGSIAVAMWISSQKPSAERSPAPRGTTLKVEAQTLALQSFQIELATQGLIRPRTESKLVTQVGGELVVVSDKLREGSFFEKGDLLARIDDRDYRAEVEIAAASVVEAELKLAEEKVRGEQAARDWARFGEGGSPPDLVLRKPQLASAEAALRSAAARLTSARLKLERTQLRAPFAGRVQKKLADLGQVVSAGASLAEIYAVDRLELRLPLDSRALEFVDLPEPTRNKPQQTGALPKVQVLAQHGKEIQAWPARIVRVEGAIDSATRQLFVVAQIDDPYGTGGISDSTTSARAPLKIGQFVEARVLGRTLAKVFVLPRSAVRQDDTVLLVDGERLRSRKVVPLWRDRDVVLVREGLQAGEILSLTPLGAGADGAKVSAKIDGVEPAPPAKQAGNEAKGGERQGATPGAKQATNPGGKPAATAQ